MYINVNKSTYGNGLITALKSSKNIRVSGLLLYYYLLCYITLCSFQNRVEEIRENVEQEKKNYNNYYSRFNFIIIIL